MMTQYSRRFGMARIFTAALGCATFVLVSCQEPKAGESGANASGSKRGIIEIVGGDTINWGKTGPGVLKHALKITNVGGDTLKLVDVTASCGCTTAPLNKKVLLPGDTATVDVSMDVANRVGEQHKSLTVTSSDSARKTISISLLAEILRDVVATPEFFPPVREAQKGREDSTSIELRNSGDQAITIQPPTLPSAADMLIRFDMASPITLQPGEARRVVAFVKPIKDGTSSAEVIFPVDGKLQKEIKVNLTSTVAPPQG